MAAENTAFLSDNEYRDDPDAEEYHPITTAPANSHFTRPLKVLTTFIILLSIAAFGLLIASFVICESGRLNGTWRSAEVTRDLIIVLFVNILLLVPTLFVQVPIILNVLVQTTMSVVVLVYSIFIFSEGWPRSWQCQRWGGPNEGYLPEDPDCRKAQTILQILMGIAAGLGLVVGILLLATIYLRLVAIVRARPWKGRKYSAIPGFDGSSWTANGFTIQLTFKITKQQEQSTGGSANLPQVSDPSSRGGPSNLIET